VTYFEKGDDQNGLPRYRFHDLRHAAGSLFIEQGMTPKRVRKLCGIQVSR
jgi:integrase